MSESSGRHDRAGRVSGTSRTGRTGRTLLAVGLGGAAGTLARAGLEELRPHDAVHLPTATLTVNLVGAQVDGQGRRPG